MYIHARTDSLPVSAVGRENLKVTGYKKPFLSVKPWIIDYISCLD